MGSAMEWLTEGPALMIGFPIAMYVLGLIVGAWGADKNNGPTREYIKYLEQVNDDLLAELDRIDNACYIKDRTSSDAYKRKEKTNYGKSSKKKSAGSREKQL